MTNQLTPQQLLEIARVVYPDKNWVLCGFGRDVISTNSLGHVTIFEPHKATERGQAQLMQVVFKVGSEVHKRLTGVSIKESDSVVLVVSQIEHELCLGLRYRDPQTILSLAHEVLCANKNR